MQSSLFASSVSGPAARPRRTPPRLQLRAVLLICWLIIPLHARSDGERSRIHAVIGQPLSIQVPLRLSGTGSANVDIGVEPGSGVPDAERKVAESVIATYDPVNSRVHLTTVEGVTVPIIRLRLLVTTDMVSITQNVDVLVDLPDLNRHFDRPDAGEQAAGSDSEAVNGIKVFEVHHAQQARLFGDSASADGMASSSGRPTATPAPLAMEVPASPALHPERTAKKHSHDRRPVAEQGLGSPEVEPPPRTGEEDAHAHPASGWFEAVSLRLARATVGAKGLPGFIPGEPDRRVQEIVAAGASSALLIAMLMLYRLRRRRSRFRYPPARQVNHAADDRTRIGPQPGYPPHRGEVDELARLRRMLDENPGRVDIRYQLVQRLYKAGDAASFARVAPPLRSAVSEETWRRVQAMADELLPGDARFGPDTPPDRARRGTR